MNLSSQQRHALARARATPLRRVHNPTLPGQPKWPYNIHANTLASLVKRGLLERDELRNRHGYKVDQWTITDVGRQALQPPSRHRSDRDEYPGIGGGRTQDPARSVDYEWATVTTPDGRRVRTRTPIAIMDPGSLQPRWRRSSDERHTQAQDRKKLAEKLGQNARRAA